jgi:hypothetical protein
MYGMCSCALGRATGAEIVANADVNRRPVKEQELIETLNCADGVGASESSSLPKMYVVDEI